MDIWPAEPWGAQPALSWDQTQMHPELWQGSPLYPTLQSSEVKFNFLPFLNHQAYFQQSGSVRRCHYLSTDFLLEVLLFLLFLLFVQMGPAGHRQLFEQQLHFPALLFPLLCLQLLEAAPVIDHTFWTWVEQTWPRTDKGFRPADIYKQGLTSAGSLLNILHSRSLHISLYRAECSTYNEFYYNIICRN